MKKHNFCSLTDVGRCVCGTRGKNSQRCKNFDLSNPAGLRAVSCSAAPQTQRTEMHDFPARNCLLICLSMSEMKTFTVFESVHWLSP